MKSKELGVLYGITMLINHKEAVQERISCYYNGNFEDKNMPHISRSYQSA